jgi:crotonobetainyl-CoA:carnitine CoA-transferase CaiB-like acyl-CoA transferase
MAPRVNSELLLRRPAPLLGENTAEVLTELGYSDEESRKIAGGS